MTELIQIYGLAIIASIFLGGGLALLGMHLAARERAMESLCVSQGAMIGVLFGLSFSQSFFLKVAPADLVTFVCGFMASAMTFLLSEKLTRKGYASNSTFAVALFMTLTAFSNILVATAPQLETHMTQRFFGDLATMSDKTAWYLIIAGLVLISLFLLLKQTFSRDSFALAVMGVKRTPSSQLFTIVSLAAVCLSVQFAGLLFTAGCLFVPTAVLSFSNQPSLKRHAYLCVVLTSLSCGAGFILTLWHTKLPTVPTIVILLTIMSLVTLTLERLAPKVRR